MSDITLPPDPGGPAGPALSQTSAGPQLSACQPRPLPLPTLWATPTRAVLQCRGARLLFCPPLSSDLSCGCHCGRCCGSTSLCLSNYKNDRIRPSATSVSIRACVPCDTSRFVWSEPHTARWPSLLPCFSPLFQLGGVPHAPTWDEPTQVTHTGWAGPSRAGGLEGKARQVLGAQKEPRWQRERNGVVAGHSQPRGLGCPEREGAARQWESVGSWRS